MFKNKELLVSLQNTKLRLDVHITSYMIYLVGRGSRAEDEAFREVAAGERSSSVSRQGWQQKEEEEERQRHDQSAQGATLTVPPLFVAI
jgi:hypothetical protein